LLRVSATAEPDDITRAHNPNLIFSSQAGTFAKAGRSSAGMYNKIKNGRGLG